MASGREFARHDREAAANFAAAAERAGVRRIIYLGGLVPDDAQTEHIQSRRDTGEILRGVARDQGTVIFPLQMRLLCGLDRLAPGLVARLLQRELARTRDTLAAG